VYVERNQRLEKVTDGLFEGEEAVLHVIERIVAPLGLRVDESSPWVDARLSDGSRVQTRFLRTPFFRWCGIHPDGGLTPPGVRGRRGQHLPWMCRPRERARCSSHGRC
jgi:hypothetical protein